MRCLAVESEVQSHVFLESIPGVEHVQGPSQEPKKGSSETNGKLPPELERPLPVQASQSSLDVVEKRTLLREASSLLCQEIAHGNLVDCRGCCERGHGPGWCPSSMLLKQDNTQTSSPRNPHGEG